MHLASVNQFLFLAARESRKVSYEKFYIEYSFFCFQALVAEVAFVGAADFSSRRDGLFASRHEDQTRRFGTSQSGVARQARRFGFAAAHRSILECES